MQLVSVLLELETMNDPPLLRGSENCSVGCICAAHHGKSPGGPGQLVLQNNKCDKRKM